MQQHSAPRVPITRQSPTVTRYRLRTKKRYDRIRLEALYPAVLQLGTKSAVLVGITYASSTTLQRLRAGLAQLQHKDKAVEVVHLKNRIGARVLFPDHIPQGVETSPMRSSSASVAHQQGGLVQSKHGDLQPGRGPVNTKTGKATMRGKNVLVACESHLLIPVVNRLNQFATLYGRDDLSIINVITDAYVYPNTHMGTNSCIPSPDGKHLLARSSNSCSWLINQATAFTKEMEGIFMAFKVSKRNSRKLAHVTTPSEATQKPTVKELNTKDRDETHLAVVKLVTEKAHGNILTQLLGIKTPGLGGLLGLRRTQAKAA